MEAQSAAVVQAISPAESQASAGQERIHWGLGKRTGFRFVFIYWLLYNLPFPIGELPYTDAVAIRYERLWQIAAAWTGKHVLHLSYPITIFESGSGDKTYDWVRALITICLTFAGTLIWTLLDRKRPDYARLSRWLRVYIRIVLGATLIGYGAYKVIKTQFPAPFFFTLMEPYGEASPMGLLWTFMGFSTSYNVFTGLVEMIGGGLLFVPRLTTLGGLISAAAMTNVFILNMSYDVPVKLYSFHLLLMAVFLIAPDFGRLLKVFILNRPAEPLNDPPLFTRVLANRIALGVQLAAGLAFVAISLNQSYQASKQYGARAARPALYGIWNVDEFTADGAVRPPLMTDDLRWRRLAFDILPTFITVQKMNGELSRYGMKLDMEKKQLSITKRAPPAWNADFAIDNTQPDQLVLDGQMQGHKIHAKLTRQDEKKLLLNSRGFHWVSEYPFNR